MNIVNRLTRKVLAAGFLSQRTRILLAWPLACLVLGCLVWGMTFAKLREEKAKTRAYAFHEASSLSKAYAAQLARTVDQIDQITLSLKYYWQKTPGALDLQQQLQQGLYPASAHLWVTIVDREGRPVTSTININKNSPRVANREHFLAHKNDASIGLRISAPVIGNGLAKTVILFSRRLDTADGTFDGLVVVAAEPVYLASFTHGSTLSQGDFLSVTKGDGVMLARKVGEGRDVLTTHFRSVPVFQSDAGVVSLSQEKFVDKQSRIVAWQKIPAYPLVSTVGLAEKGVFAAYEDKARDYVRIAAAISILLVFSAIVVTRLSSRMAAKRQQADEAMKTFRLAIDGAREGFYMVRAVYNEHGCAVDFVFEHCNERGAALLGLGRRQLVGVKLSDIYKGDYADALAATFRLALETGFYEDEFRVLPACLAKASWINRKLVRSGDGLAITLRDISDVKGHEEALSRLANADAVTSLPNRHWLVNYLPTAVRQARHGGAALALLFVDLDDFKNINDTLGHASGDQLLRAMALRLKSLVRPQDHVVRLGGDEFTVILERVESDDAVSHVADRIIMSLREPFLLAGASSHVVHASIGISMFPRDGADGETLLKHADIAMYAVKANGKGQWAFYQPQLSRNLALRLDKEQALRQAFECDQFVLHYQPRVDTFSGELRSLEALVRWQHPQHGLIPPDEFIPLAEGNGSIVQLGELVIEKTCAQLAAWKAQGLPLVPVSINVSPRQFDRGDVSHFLAACMARHGIAPSLVEVEITESCMMGADPAVAARLAAMAALGVKLLVDDFGTGYSSLALLKQFDMDVLKVDRIFTARLGKDKDDEAFFRAILSMAHVLGMSVVAEGVETLEQLSALQALSCDEVQGYLISRPVAASAIPALMHQRYLGPLAKGTGRHSAILPRKFAEKNN
jgi:diguanylate cyclase (GGDEF)-like protein